MNALHYEQPFLVAFGGPPGSGKTVLSARLAADLRVPRLSADTIGRTISTSGALIDRTINSQWIAYDVLFQLGIEFVQLGVSTIFDVNLGWLFQWQRLELIQQHYPMVRVLPIVLRCSRDVCLQRIEKRYLAAPDEHAPPDLFTTEPAILKVWSFLEHLDRADTHVVDAAKPLDDVYADITDYLAIQLKSAP